MNRTRQIALVAAATALLTGVALPAAQAKDGDVVRRGDCAGTADWKLKAGAEDGRIEVEAEVDSNRSGQLWRWRLVHDGTRVASGAGVTGGRSGSFEVRRVVANHTGSDTLVFRARRPATGQVCRGVLTF